ncbi:LemA family protein [Mucilaginibacter ginsenosidivorans]|uniref:LemA family protein n=1 Tax=Mucilaginibacter ginsenosidivorans TaxID=398053 RepID=A0A5B8UUF4_9SPHI|nr:LemA family protein [Mucilaginibacter ginsenosidivorans]QEC62750.1 LemA family protein [Mucilaginibacter ginsenosidivorans]
MKTSYIVIGVILFILLIGGCGGVSSYNKMVALDETVKAKWGTVQADYQRRADLIPNLVETVKGAANFEKSTLVDVTNARARATSIQVDPTKLDPAAIQKFQAAQGQLSTALGRLLVASEKYPELKANDNFSALQAQLEGTENRIKVSRMDFNNAVQDYNTKIRSFPGNIIANMTGFQPKGSFQAEAGSEKAPSVKF